MINLCLLPTYTGNLEELEKAASGLRTDAAGIRRGGTDIHSRFQALAGVYVAPEADDLFRTTQPVMDNSETFATKLETVADALDTFITEAKPLETRLKALNGEATSFFQGVADDEDWQDDDDKVDQHNALRDRIGLAAGAFQEAERRAATKIAALVGDVRFVGASDSETQIRGKHDITYGLDPDAIANAKELPWGTPLEEPHDADYWVRSFFWDGLVHDNVVPAGVGAFNLLTLDGETWGGLGQVGLGLKQYVIDTPMVNMAGMRPGGGVTLGDTPQKQALRQFGKGFVAWDMWSENPARAASTVVFNGLTIGAGPLASVARSGRAGTATKIAGGAATVGTYLDPLSAGIAGTAKVSQALPRLSSLTESLRATLPMAADTQRLYTHLELNGARVRLEDGRFAVLDQHGNPVAHAVPEEAALANRQEARAPQEAGVGAAGARGHDSTTSASRTPDARLPPPPRTPPQGGGHSASPDGPSPSGTGRSDSSPRGDGAPLSREEIVNRQVERANSDPDWRRQHYRSNGRRQSGVKYDDLGELLADMHFDRATGKFSAALHQKPAPPEYLNEAIRHNRSGANPQALQELDDAAKIRRDAIDSDLVKERELKAAKEAYRDNPTIENENRLLQERAEHAPLHHASTKASETFGELVAARQAIPDHYPGAEQIELRGPKNGNDQFDLAYRTREGGFVIVEAKSSLKTDFNPRTPPGPDGARVSQGTRAYFDDILRVMRERSLKSGDPYEHNLARDLKRALNAGKLDYVVVKGNPVGHEYHGYSIQKFDISQGNPS